MRRLPVIHGSRIILRPFNSRDAVDYSAWLKDEYLRKMVGESRLSPSAVVEKQEVWARDDKIVEYIQRYRDAGYWTEAAECFMSYAKGVLGMQELYAEIFPFNKKSISFHEKLKFSKVGNSVDAKNRDCVVYYMNLKS